MGVHPNIDFNRFPKQSPSLGKSVEVVFNYDTSRQIKGQIVRCDHEEPLRMIIALEDGRFVLSSECQYRFLD